MSLHTTASSPARPAEDARDARLPGGSLLAAIQDRRLMGWSDRGGASRHIGDRWAVRCAAFLRGRIGQSWPVPDGESYLLLDVLRLDENPDIEREANANQLENPDFLLIGNRAGMPVLQAVDAKFAADRIKVSQVSPEVVGRLLTIPVQGVTRGLVDERLAEHGLAAPELVRGIFVGPESEMTEALLRRALRARDAELTRADLLPAPVDPGELFAGLPMSRLIGSLARLDALPVTPRTSLLSAVYYLRLSCACFYFWNESHRPLLGPVGATPEPEPGLVAAETARRIRQARTAYQLAVRWDSDTQQVSNMRKAVQEVAALPLTMRELREEFQAQHVPEAPRALRTVRGALEREFREHLLAYTGEIMPDDPRTLDAILRDVAAAARSQRAQVRERMRAQVAAQVQGA